jgi:transposase InsO family protein
MRRGVCERRQSDQELLQKILSIYEGSRGIYGSPRVFKALKQQGIAIGRKRVERLMRVQGLKGRVVKVTRRVPGLKRFVLSGENVRLKEPEITGLNQAWVSDITFIRLGNTWRFLAVVMDLYSRKVLGWSLAANRTTQLTLAALRHALKGRTIKPGLIFHTDRGIEYTAFCFREVLLKYGIRPSTNRPKYCTDNAHMESFFHSLKTELIRGNKFHTEEQLRHALASYINHFYNKTRLHSGINYQTPEHYEKLVA